MDIKRMKNKSSKLNPLCIGNFANEEMFVESQKIGSFLGGAAFRGVLTFAYFGMDIDYITAITDKSKKWNDALKLLSKYKANAVKLIRTKNITTFIWNYFKDKRNYSLKTIYQDNMSKVDGLVDSEILEKHSFVLLYSLGYENEKNIINKIEKNGNFLAYVFHQSNLDNCSSKKYFELFKKVDILFLNEFESFSLTNNKNSKTAGVLLSKYVKKEVVITRANKSVLIFKDGKLIHESYPLLGEVKDSSGCGDVFAAGTMVGYELLNKNIESACRYGNIAAFLSIADNFTDNFYKTLQKNN